MMRTAASLLCLALVAPVHAQAAPRDSLLDRLVGRWVMRGNVGRQQTVHDLDARWVLGNEYVEMHEVSRERTDSGAPQYEAIIYVGRDPHTREYAAEWFDNTGYGAFDRAGVGHAMSAGDSIPFIFRSATDSVHNTFVYDRAHDTWEMRIDNDDARGRRPFARLTMTRAAPADTLRRD